MYHLSFSPQQDILSVCVWFCYVHRRDSGTPSSEVFLVRVTPTSWHLGLFLYVCNKNAVAQLIFIKILDGTVVGNWNKPCAVLSKNESGVSWKEY